MLTKLIVRKFKRLDSIDIELGSPVVFIGPNNSGKTTALQALALWDVGVKRWVEKRGFDKGSPTKRPGVAINRLELISIPLPNARLLWQNLHVRDVQRVAGKTQTQNIRIEISVEGVTESVLWQCGMEFDYSNTESIYCRPLRLKNDGSTRMLVPEAVTKVQMAYLPPMSGLAANETSLDPGAINVRIGEGRTAEVLRNLCFNLFDEPDQQVHWRTLQAHIRLLFGIQLNSPEYIPQRGEIKMSYQDSSGIQLDISSSGRGLQQTLLLLAYLYANPGATLLLDEPDAHLEILRQRQIYRLLTDVARQQGGQIVAASHSEVVLNEAADKDVVIAFVGKPHRIDDRGSQLLKALKEIGYDQYYQAEQTGWVLYLEGSTDLDILFAFAKILNHPAKQFLERPFVHYIGNNQPTKARQHFYGLKEAKDNLVGAAIFDRLDKQLEKAKSLVEMMWQRREIENYLCYPEVLITYAEQDSKEDVPGPLFSFAESEKRKNVMNSCINDLVPPVALRNREDSWWQNVKASDEFLDRLFEMYYEQLELPNLMRKSDYHNLARLIPEELIVVEIKEKLDNIVAVAEASSPGR